MGKIKISKIIFVKNKNSGSSFLIDKLLLSLIEFINTNYTEVEAIQVALQDVDSLEVYCAQFEQMNTLFVACGGDGTVTYVAESIFKSNVKNYLSVIPFGTGNDFSREIGTFSIRNDISKLAECFLGENKKKNIYEIPLWKFNLKVFLNYFSIGFDAKVAYCFDHLRSCLPSFFNRPFFNRCLYGVAGICNIASGIKRGAVELVCHNELILLDNLKLLIFANINSYGGGYPLVESRKTGNSKLMMLKIKKLGSFIKILFGQKWVNSRIEELTEFKINVNQKTYAQLDGEPFVMDVGKYEVKMLDKILVLGWK